MVFYRYLHAPRSPFLLSRFVQYSNFYIDIHPFVKFPNFRVYHKSDNNDTYNIQLYLPNASKDDLAIEFNNNGVDVTYDRYVKHIELKFDTDPCSGYAVYSNNMLNITFNKTLKRNRQIDIQFN
jgi:HSP20 family molecular chaperone IbpA